MKKFFILIFLLLIIAAISLFVFILTFDANRYAPLLIERVEQAIQKDVKIGNISLNFLPGLSLRIDGVSVKDAGNTWEDAILKAASIDARVKLLPLLKKDIEIEHLHIRGLNINITKDSMLAPRKAMQDGSDVDTGLAVAGTLTFLAKSVTISDSSIIYAGNALKAPGEIKIDIKEALFKNISLYGPAHVEATLSIFGRGLENIKLSALVYPEFETKNPYVKNLDLRIDLSRFNLIGVLNALGKSEIASHLIGKEITGEMAIASEEIYLDLKKIYNSNVYINLSNAKTDMLPIKDGLEDIELTAEMAMGNIVIQKLAGKIQEGTFLAKGSLRNVRRDQRSDLDIALRNINISKLLPDAGPTEPQLEGTLNINMHSQANGLKAQEILDTLTLEGVVELDGAILRNMNILTAALGKLNMLPGLVERLKRNLPEYYKELLKQNYTTFEPLEAEFKMKERRLFFPKAIIESDAFYLTGRGYLDIEGKISVSSDLFVPRDLSEAFIDVVGELEFLQNREGMITMPLEISGKLPHISVRPDLDYVIQRLAVSKGQELLERIFKKEIPTKTEGGGAQGSQTDPDEPQETKEEIEPAEVLIRTIFDIISTPSGN